MLIKKLKTMANLLAEVHDNVGHYEAITKDDRYIVWQEEAEGDSIFGNNIKENQVITGSIDLYTNTEFDELIDKIQNALNIDEISWALNSVQYEEETELIHYEWTWEM